MNVLLTIMFAMFAAPNFAFAEAEVDASTPTLTVRDLYDPRRLRDPFMSLSGKGGGILNPERPEFNPDEDDVSELIRVIELKGVTRDKTGVYALFVDPSNGRGFSMMRGRLYDSHNTRIPGVRAKMRYKHFPVLINGKPTGAKERRPIVILETEDGTSARFELGGKDKPDKDEDE